MPAGPWSRYDDGGCSGGSTDGPDLQRLLDDSRTTLHKLSRDGDNVWRGAPLLSIHERGWRTPGPGGVAVLDLQVTGILLRSRHPEGCRCGDESSRARLVDAPMLYAMVEAARSFWNRCPIVSRRRAGGVAIFDGGVRSRYTSEKRILGPGIAKPGQLAPAEIIKEVAA